MSYEPERELLPPEAYAGHGTGRYGKKRRMMTKEEFRASLKRKAEREALERYYSTQITTLT